VREQQPPDAFAAHLLRRAEWGKPLAPLLAVAGDPVTLDRNQETVLVGAGAK